MKPEIIDIRLIEIWRLYEYINFLPRSKLFKDIIHLSVFHFSC